MRRGEMEIPRHAMCRCSGDMPRRIEIRQIGNSERRAETGLIVVFRYFGAGDFEWIALGYDEATHEIIYKELGITGSAAGSVGMYREGC